ncbi:MAG: T9SS type A sorting domain-containing protein [Bacteroidia bacterium]|nr:T9SS type A sorting domain-containing protein [Bacteroidia bacterium]
MVTKVLSKLARGVYTMRIKADDEIIIKKLIKQ